MRHGVWGGVMSIYAILVVRLTISIAEVHAAAEIDRDAHNDACGN